MKPRYYDILRVSDTPPLWWDELGVPRFETFEPHIHISRLAYECVLLNLQCQVCRKPYIVSMSNRVVSHLESAIRNRTLDYGTPPRGCFTEDPRTHFLKNENPSLKKCNFGASMTPTLSEVIGYWRKNTSSQKWVEDISFRNLNVGYVNPYREISREAAEAILTKHLIGLNVNKVEYFITGWNLRLLGRVGPELTLQASEMTLTNLYLWREKLSDLPVDILDTGEPDDVIIAAVIFTVINKWSISDVKINEKSDLILGFENKSEIVIKGVVDYIDYVWEINQRDGTNLVFCDTGRLSTHL